MKKKITFSIFILTLSGLLYSLLPTNSAHAVLYGTLQNIKYTSKTTITVTATQIGPGQGQVSTTNTNYNLNPNGSGSECSDALYYSIDTASGGAYGTHPGFWVYKNRPLLVKSGTLHVNTGVIGGSVEGDATGLAILDPDKLAPEAIDIQSVGKNLTINGQIKFQTRDGSGKPINEELIAGKLDAGKRSGGELKVWLMDSCGTEIQIGGTNNRGVIFEDGIYTWNQITVPQDLYTNTTYTLKTNIPDDKYVDCTTGLEGGNKLSEQCKLTYHGRVDFMITKDNKIQIVGNSDADWEAKSTGRGFPVTLANRKNGFNLTVVETLDSPLDKALSSTIKWLANLVETGLQVTMNWVDSLLNSTDEYVLGKGTPGNTGVEPAWTKIRNISLTLLVLALIVIAFANVFQVNIEQYGLNRMIPKIIIAIIMAYMSWVFVLFFFDLASVIQAQANSFLSSGSGISLMGSVSIQTPTSADILAKMGAILVLIILLFGAWVCGIVLLFLLLLRIVMLSFLLAVAPMAMIANIMPFTSNLYKKWWNEFFKWMFMGPIATAIIALGTIIATNTGFGTDTNKFDESVVSNASTPGSGVNLLVGILILAASMYMAATLPLKWGGNLMGRWAGAGKKLWGNTGGKIVGGLGAGAAGMGKLAGMGAVAGISKIPGVGKLTALPDAYKMGKNQFMNKVNTGKQQRAGELLRSTGKANPFLNKDDIASIDSQLEGSYYDEYKKYGFERVQKAYQNASAIDPRTGKMKDATMARALAKVSQDKFGGAHKVEAGAGQVNNDGDWTSTNAIQRDINDKAAKSASAATLAQLFEGSRDFRNGFTKENQELSIMAAMQMTDQVKAGQVYGAIASGNASQSWDKKSDKFLGESVKKYNDIIQNHPSSANAVAAYSQLTQQVAGGGAPVSDEQFVETLKAQGLTELEAQVFHTTQKTAKSWQNINGGQQAQQTAINKANDKVGAQLTKLNSIQVL